MRSPAIPIAFSLALLAAGPAFAGSCAPVDATARVLSSPSPNDVHPDWRGENTIGTSWSLETAGRKVRKGDTVYLKGDLYSPRGGIVNKGVFVIADEWDCDE